MELKPETVEALTPLFPAEASIRNPLDMIASATPSAYRTALSALLADEGVDQSFRFCPASRITQEDVAEAITEAVKAALERPLFQC